MGYGLILLICLLQGIDFISCFIGVFMVSGWLRFWFLGRWWVCCGERGFCAMVLGIREVATCPGGHARLDALVLAYRGLKPTYLPVGRRLPGGEMATPLMIEAGGARF